MPNFCEESDALIREIVRLHTEITKVEANLWNKFGIKVKVETMTHEHSNPSISDYPQVLVLISEIRCDVPWEPRKEEEGE